MFLGIDLGEKTTGLATSNSTLATPYKTVTHKNQKEALEKISKEITDLGVDTVVLGFVEGKIKSLFEKFAKTLKTTNPNLEIVLWDETLTSRQATEQMVTLHVAKQKRQKRQHEIAAALILQGYLDSLA